ncbi:hypothetical protein HDU67_006818, partial [Dinochytrium kinnereticum]
MSPLEKGVAQYLKLSELPDMSSLSFIQRQQKRRKVDEANQSAVEFVKSISD